MESLQVHATQLLKSRQVQEQWNLEPPTRARTTTVQHHICSGHLTHQKVDGGAPHQLDRLPGTVVRGGSVQFIRDESSKPTTETSEGVSRPALRTARTTPRARE